MRDEQEHLEAKLLGGQKVKVSSFLYLPLNGVKDWTEVRISLDSPKTWTPSIITLLQSYLLRGHLQWSGTAQDRGSAPGRHKREFPRAQHIACPLDQFVEVCGVGTEESAEMEGRKNYNPENGGCANGDVP